MSVLNENEMKVTDYYFDLPQEQIAQDGSYAIENLVVEGINQYQEIPSISSYYPAVFPFENEAHDLFGLAITDMQIDFKGFFYQVSTAEPTRPY